MTGTCGKIPLLVVAGPTAAGKSEVGLKITRQAGGEIVSADSAQVYRYLDIGTAKPGREERKTVPHHLIDIIDLDEEFNVNTYKRLADKTIAEVHRRGKLPVLLGGTGLYLRAVIDNYAFSSRGKNEELRQELYRQAEIRGEEYLHRRLQEVDPVSAKKISPSDKKRMVRALEVYYTEGKPLSEQEEETRFRETPYELIYVGLYTSRDMLYRKIEERVDEMIRRGFLEEVKWLLQWYPPEARGLQILGYRELVCYLYGMMDWEETVEEIKKQTRRLAKRQLTWFRRDKRIVWLEHKPGETARVVGEISNLLKEKACWETNI